MCVGYWFQVGKIHVDNYSGQALSISVDGQPWHMPPWNDACGESDCESHSTFSCSTKLLIAMVNAGIYNARPLPSIIRFAN